MDLASIERLVAATAFICAGGSNPAGMMACRPGDGGRRHLILIGNMDRVSGPAFSSAVETGDSAGSAQSLDAARPPHCPRGSGRWAVPFGGPPYLRSSAGPMRARRSRRRRSHLHSPDYGLWHVLSRRARLCRALALACRHRAAGICDSLRRSALPLGLPRWRLHERAMECRPCMPCRRPRGRPCRRAAACPPRPARSVPDPWLWRGSGAFHMAASWPLTAHG